ncbi:hypothetical protein SUDANB1_05236 [Streptomyces sp. enrichment culture]|uniref:hypothetical protein n=1 Tax=Streptomyces sp. enrichment culture TaxID=1795815 RepID=UPI003F55D1B5
MNAFVTTAGAIAAVIAAVVAGWFSVRGSRAAAAPQQRQVDLSVLQASVERLEKECGEMRQQIVRLRTFLWVAVGWAKRRGDQVERLGGTPEPTPGEIEEFYRTGV